MNDQAEMPEVVIFTSQGVECRAFVAFDNYGLNMRSCQVMFRQRPSVDIMDLPDATRVRINNGEVWFDTSGDSAAAIKALFETGKAPI